MRMRVMTDEDIRATARAGSGDSTAAMVTISAPIMEKITVGTAATTASQPLGAKPPCAVRLANPVPPDEMSPNAYAAATRMKAMMAVTLIEENQNSNSPYARAESRFTPVMMAISATPISQVGHAIHFSMIAAPAIASTGTT